MDCTEIDAVKPVKTSKCRERLISIEEDAVRVLRADFKDRITVNIINGARHHAVMQMLQSVAAESLASKVSGNIMIGRLNLELEVQGLKRPMSNPVHDELLARHAQGEVGGLHRILKPHVAMEYGRSRQFITDMVAARVADVFHMENIIARLDLLTTDLFAIVREKLKMLCVH